MNLARLESYHARMQRVLVFIDNHLDEELDLERLSGVAAFSKHHFQRQFTSLFGISPLHYVRLARLKNASRQLAKRDGLSVTNIALDHGYHAPEAFARAFKRSLGQTPTQFREQPDSTPWSAAFEPLTQARRSSMTSGFRDEQVKIVDFPETEIAMIQHRGDHALLGETIRRFVEWRRKTGHSLSACATFNVIYDDPEEVPPDDYRIDICVSTKGDIEPNEEGVESGVITGGRCAVLRSIGHADELGNALTFLYADWLPRSGEELRDTPLFVQRVRIPPAVPEGEAVTDIFVPLA